MGGGGGLAICGGEVSIGGCGGRWKRWRDDDGIVVDAGLGAQRIERSPRGCALAIHEVGPTPVRRRVTGMEHGATSPPPPRTLTRNMMGMIQMLLRMNENPFLNALASVTEYIESGREYVASGS